MASVSADESIENIFPNTPDHFRKPPAMVRVPRTTLHAYHCVLNY